MLSLSLPPLPSSSFADFQASSSLSSSIVSLDEEAAGALPLLTGFESRSAGLDMPLEAADAASVAGGTAAAMVDTPRIAEEAREVVSAALGLK